MVIITPSESKVGIGIRGNINAPSTYGIRKYGAFDYGAGADTFGIYRVRHRWGKIIQEKMPYYVPTNPQTGAQQANRQKIANAVALWQTLTDEQKEVYNEKAKGKDYSGYNLYLSEYLLSH